MDAAAPDNNNQEQEQSNNSPVKRVVDEVVNLMADIHDAKEELIARGIPLQHINVTVSMNISDKKDEFVKMRDSALEMSRTQHGTMAIKPEKLDEHLATLVALEKDLGHARWLGMQQGFDMTAINNLTMIIRQNPGDGGEKVVNTFLAYALVCGIPLHKVAQMASEATSSTNSVLPNIPREQEADTKALMRKRMVSDICIGCVMAFFALAWLT